MNATLNEHNSFEQVVKNICDKVSGIRHQIKKEYGTGFIEFIQVLPQIEFLYAELAMHEPFMVKWDYKNTNNENFYLLHVETAPIDATREDDYATAENGTSLISQNNSRHTLWLPNVRYKVISVKFTLEWVNFINEKISLPENVRSFVNGHSDLMLLQVKQNADIKLVISQMYKYKKLVDKGAQVIYVHGKIIELILLIFHITLPVASEKKSKDSVHIDDYNSILNFANNFSANGVIPDKIDNVAKSLGMSRSKFQRLFNLVMGKTYYNFVLEVRMVKALEMLMEKKSVTEISFITGYSAVSNFTHAFRNYFNMLPSEIK